MYLFTHNKKLFAFIEKNLVYYNQGHIFVAMPTTASSIHVVIGEIWECGDNEIPIRQENQAVGNVAVCKKSQQFIFSTQQIFVDLKVKSLYYNPTLNRKNYTRLKKEV